jgi:hypothetical protein
MGVEGATIEGFGPATACRAGVTFDIAKYNDTFRRLGQEAVACAPAEWNRGRLTIASDGQSLQCRLEGDSIQTRVALTQQLGRLCGELYILMEMDGQRWSKCVIGFTKTPKGSWNFDVKFSYCS